MIKLLTDCEKCTHSKVCRYNNNAKNAMEDLREMIYGENTNDDYYWDVMSDPIHVTIGFSCDNFEPRMECLR